MRSYDSSDEYDQKRILELNTSPWQVKLLDLNPEYCSWGPYEDSMTSDGQWNSPVFYNSWKDFDWGLNDLNELVNFYFELTRHSKNCECCEQTGYNPETYRISEDFYDFNRTGRKWCAKITEDELQVLKDKGRIKPEKNP